MFSRMGRAASDSERGIVELPVFETFASYKGQTSPQPNVTTTSAAQHDLVSPASGGMRR
jgi:hypothetical protein